ncbi:MAG: hypothetical protein D4R64_10935 [Porphyromonadaceae bacterium]|nr:MAG: hypothetical protein D4R64_10935 [Porphyromonadaceae bacterium]
MNDKNMKQIPVFFEMIDRTAMILKPKQPFLDWLNAIDPEVPGNKQDNDYDVYLLPEFDEVNQMETWLKKNFDQFFCDQMNGWYTDESRWVKNRTIKMFKEWFDYSLHSMVLDTQEEDIEKI